MEAKKELWRPTNLSIILPNIHKSVDDLKCFLQDKGVNSPESNRKFQDLEGGINALVQAFSLHPWIQGAESNSPSLIRNLSEDARRTLWDNVPILAIAKAHKEKADVLTKQGGPCPRSTSNTLNTFCCTHVATRTANMFAEVFRKVHMLENLMPDVFSVSIS
ncbi:hypothetical protein B0H19DRAFT_1250994 [Mycena capillaripes]|nr:hypothetical protein B0H19DRAFT_1250994 [Mycena capillaripes]